MNGKEYAQSVGRERKGGRKRGRRWRQGWRNERTREEEEVDVRRSELGRNWN